MTTKKEIKTEIPPQETFNRTEVEALLRKQIEFCAESIDENNLSEYCAKMKILKTEIIKL
jgi:hypothetical protein